ncbi:hypothetical protein DYB36_011145, partial [Aphanomyces astaci]
MRQLGDNIAHAQHQQAHQANKHGRKNTSTFCVGDLVYLHKSAAPPTVLRNPKLQVPWIGPFPIKEVISPTSMKLDLPDDWRIHPTFYVGKIKRHLPRFIDGEAAPSDGKQCPAGAPRAPPAPRRDVTSHVTKTLRLFTNVLQRISLILLQLLQGKFHLPDPTMKVSNSSLCCASNHLRPHTALLQVLWLRVPFQRRFSPRQAMQDLCLRPQCRRGHLHQALDSCQSFMHGIVLQSRHAMPLHLPLNRRQASDHGVMLRRA